MTQTFDAIKQFYRSHWDKLSIFDLSFLASSCARSIPTGNAIELSFFDGYMNKRVSIKPVDRTDAAETLQLISQFLTDRLKAMTPAELEEFDRVQRIISGGSELPKRLENSDL
ncbi:MAG: hypothetical protein KME18_16720 [Phormidium tanganyikae FI6-MK23]|jgi:hypothetical protein|nr:hypothetical protein [Phormidium tanganyikae FI6-MK23]